MAFGMANETDQSPGHFKLDSHRVRNPQPLTARNTTMTSLPTEHQARPSPATVVDAANELVKMWTIFQIGQTNPISLRAISPKGAPTPLPPKNLTFNASEFPDVDARKQAFADAALRLNEIGYNCYIVLNQISTDFEGDRHNNIAVSDKDIASRQLLLIDLDRTGILGAPASDSEVAQAADVAEKISTHLASLYCLKPMKVMSGNGIHLYVPLDDIPNNAESKVCCQSLLKALANRFDTATIKVDQSVYNASRITKVPGTIARKGSEIADRPFRMARVL